MKTSNQAQVTVSKSRHSYFSFQWKSHFKKGKIVTNTDESIYNQLKENLTHHFFAEVCLNIDLSEKSGNRFIPREWFVVPLHVIDEVIQLLLNGNISNYRYDTEMEKIKLK